MPFLDTRVRVQHPCPYCDLSVAFPDVELALWTSTQSDVFHVAAPSPADLQRVLRAMLETIGARRITQEGTSALVVRHEDRRPTRSLGRPSDDLLWRLGDVSRRLANDRRPAAVRGRRQGDRTGRGAFPPSPRPARPDPLAHDDPGPSVRRTHRPPGPRLGQRPGRR